MNYYSRGKLLLSGEYLVLKGSTALAVPLKRGQELEINPIASQSILIWESKESGKTWFKAKLKLPIFEIIEATDLEIANRLIKYLKAAANMQAGFLDKISGKKISTNLEFKLEWGFGSSSTLISNIAFWAELDPYEYFKQVSLGSGYDVVCARENGPIYFCRDKDNYKVEEAHISADVSDFLYFVYMGKKKNSDESVSNFLSGKKKFAIEKKLISDLSRHMGNAATIDDFAYYMREHEQIISSVLKKPSLKETVFKDLTGEAKSLGAWGGDFSMVTWNGSKNGLTEYLKEKNIDILFTYNELVKSR